MELRRHGGRTGRAGADRDHDPGRVRAAPDRHGPRPRRRHRRPEDGGRLPRRSRRPAPSGAVFKEEAGFQKLGTTANAAFDLRHAPKPAQAIRFGAFGPVPPADEAGITAREAREGYRYVADGENDVPGETIMDYAADVAAIVCLGR